VDIVYVNMYIYIYIYIYIPPGYFLSKKVILFTKWVDLVKPHPDDEHTDKSDKDIWIGLELTIGTMHCSSNKSDLPPEKLLPE
jgi:hypothetical protein